ncbi:MAG: PP2C family protein-serine/threonine phosphatase [Lachnospiraceae bacterium]|nr:PP2C family protein-serine/threonine phosphatase [Lachnospiraceae bacterium]
MKKISLMKRFALVFVLFAIGTIAVNETMTYMAQTKAYHKHCVDELGYLASHMARKIQNSGDEFSNLKLWYKEHPDQIQVPVDFRSALPAAKSSFERYMADNYPGKVYGEDVAFNDLEFEGQRLLANYLFDYWFDEFFTAKEDFGLSYVYFIYPESEDDLTMNYMFDPTMETIETEDGKLILKLGDINYEDPVDDRYMWEAWNTGDFPDGFDSLDNEFGHEYRYCVPVKIDGEKVGLACAEISVDLVNSEIMSNVIIQGCVTAFVLIAFTVVLYILLRKNVLSRIIRIERNVKNYSENKDSDIARHIVKHAGPMDEIGGLAASFGAMIMELEDHMNNLQRVTAEKERIDADLNIATKIQADMLPKVFPAFPEREEVDIFASMTPAKEVGGDFYDFFLVDDSHLALVIADVSGKGVPAALFMVIAKTLIKNRLQTGELPGEALFNVNNQLCEGNEEEYFVTVWLAVIDLNTGDAVEANAGHEHPAIRKGNDSYTLIKTKHALPVATMEGTKFNQTEFHLDPGDMLFVYTDGATEATNANGELFGEKRLLEALNRNRDANPKMLLENVKKEIDDFVGEAPQFDDLTMLGFIYKGKSDK